MGLFDKIGDFVKSGVKEMLIARPQGNTDLIWRHPERTFPTLAQCTVRDDEWMVVARRGVPLGTLASGRATLSSEAVPFLAGLEDPASPELFHDLELCFVRQVGVDLKLDEALGARCRLVGDAVVWVENPEALVSYRFGATQPAGDDTIAWIRLLLRSDFKHAVQRLAGAGVALKTVDADALMSALGPKCAQVGLHVALKDFELRNDPAPAAPVAPATVSCEACHASVRARAFCAQCGAPLANPPRVCASCRAELLAGEKFCGGCGTAAP